MIDISAAWLHWKDLDLESIKILLPFSFVGLALGQWLDGQLSDNQSRLLVGILLLIILGVQLGKDYIMKLVNSASSEDASIDPKDSDEDEALVKAEGGSSGLSRRRGASSKVHATKTVVLSPRTKLYWAAVVGIVGGAATMLTNAMGPILNVYLLSVIGLSPTAYIGTRAYFFCFLNCGKLPLRFYYGTLGWSMMPLAGLLGLVSVVGVVGAKPIMLSMSEANFVKLELAVVAFSGLRLIWMGWFGV
jgi:uncharacterized membrane protein YfcA